MQAAAAAIPMAMQALGSMFGAGAGTAAATGLGTSIGAASAPSIAAAVPSMTFGPAAAAGSGAMLSAPMTIPATFGGMTGGQIGGALGGALGQGLGKSMVPGQGGGPQPAMAPAPPIMPNPGTAGLAQRPGAAGQLGVQPSGGAPIGSQQPLSLADLLALRKRQMGI